MDIPSHVAHTGFTPGDALPEQTPLRYCPALQLLAGVHARHTRLLTGVHASASYCAAVQLVGVLQDVCPV